MPEAAGWVARLHAYGVLLKLTYGLPVRSVLILLCKAANDVSLTGEYRDPWNTLIYEVLRVWEMSPSIFFSGLISLLPFAPLSNVAKGELPALISQMTAEIGTHYGAALQKEIWACTHVLMGLKYRPHVATELLVGVFNMLDLSTSSTYQELVKNAKAEGEARGEVRGEERGRSVEARQMLLKMGIKRLGEPDLEAQKALKAITSHERLEDLAVRLFDVESWQDLLR